MTRFCSLALLVSMLACLAGCGASDTLGDAPEQQFQGDTAQAVAPAAALKVSAQEKQAIATLQELGAVLDLDDTGHVRILELGDSQATDDDLKLLSALPHLESLDITGGAITAAGIAHLKGLVGLQRLYLHDLPITSDTLASLADLTKLDVLSLRNTQVDDEGLQRLKALTRLRVLNLAKTGISNKTLQHLQGFRELDTLVLAETKATGAGFAFLQVLKKLRVLNVNSCQDIEGHLMDLSGLTELRMLYTKDCTLSQDEIDELTDRNPKLAVFDN